MEKHGDVFTLTGDVTIDYKDYILRADKIVFNRATGDAEAEGHVQLQGGERNELILADHGTVNLNRQTGKFYDVTGSVGREAPGVAKKEVYATSNPFIITARELIKNGPQDYEVIDGAVTSCELPDPDWRIFASSILVSNGKARARNGLFDLRKVPVLYLPYVTHPVDTDSRQSGLLIPALGNSSMKGNIVGESVYWAINRSTDATVGLQYFSNYGFSPNAELRYRGDGEDFVSLHFDALFDQRHLPQFADQGGQDLRLKERHDFDPDQHTRIAATAEYLSSYVYREAFAESFSLAVASEVTSSAFLAHQADGYSEGIDFERYQNFEGITQTAAGYLTPQITILHLPSLDFETLDHPVGSSPLQLVPAAMEAGKHGGRPEPKRAEFFKRKRGTIRFLPSPLPPAALRRLDRSFRGGRARYLLYAESVAYQHHAGGASRQRRSQGSGGQRRADAAGRDAGLHIALSGKAAWRRPATHHRAGNNLPLRNGHQ
jgi:LPS-assembly protein